MSEHSLDQALRDLLYARRTGALGTRDEQGDVFVSMVPFAVDRAKTELILHVSALAVHTSNMRRSPRVSLLVCDHEPLDGSVHALPRVTLEAEAAFVETGTADAIAARTVYLDRFPDAEMMTSLADFSFVRLRLLGGRQIAGFAAARRLSVDQLCQALAAKP